MPTKTPAQRLQAQIHIARKELGMDDDTYRLALSNMTGKTSTKGMTLQELKTVVEGFRSRGFVPKKIGRRPRPPKDRAALMDKVEALLADKGLSWNYAHSMALRMFKIKRVDWLDGDQLWRLVAALEVQKRREGRRGE